MIHITHLFVSDLFAKQQDESEIDEYARERSAHRHRVTHRRRCRDSRDVMRVHGILPLPPPPRHGDNPVIVEELAFRSGYAIVRPRRDATRSAFPAISGTDDIRFQLAFRYQIPRFITIERKRVPHACVGSVERAQAAGRLMEIIPAIIARAKR